VCRVESEIQSITTLASGALTFTSFASASSGLVYYATLPAVRLVIASGSVGVPSGCPAVPPSGYDVGVVPTAVGLPCEDSNVQYVTKWTTLTTLSGGIPLPDTALPASPEYCLYLRLTGYRNVLEYSSSSLHIKLATFSGVWLCRRTAPCRDESLVCVCVAVTRFATSRACVCV
jgi:hypothetical protein